MKLIINRGLIVFNSLIRWLVNKKRVNVIDENYKVILIVFQQIFGDSIIISDSLHAYKDLFSEKEGYEIVFLARPSVLAFMKETLSLPDEIKYESLDFKKYLEDYKYYRKCNERFEGKIDTLIVPGTSLSAEIFSTSCNAKRKIGLIRSLKVKGSFITKLFSQIAYTEKVKTDKDDMMLQRHRQLLNYLGNNSYKARLPELIKKEKEIKDIQYCVLCPGASKMEKCWPTERFSEVIDFIIEHYNMNVHLCGGTEEIQYERLIYAQVKYPERIISHIGKTTFSEWSSIVQHADLVIGNDSATMHLAAASRRKAICIAGVYDKYQFFPYKVDELDEIDRLPNTIIKEMHCEWCRTKGYDAGFGNSECTKRIKENKCALCIEAITVDEVKAQIMHEMEGNEL
ncbi:MAG: glycosyltransferase family 9 protein [Lachnospiraceae bacterium]|nr:glycosyltransferase family 9 protein [Lachnospiraceae bacterium]